MGWGEPSLEHGDTLPAGSSACLQQPLERHPSGVHAALARRTHSGQLVSLGPVHPRMKSSSSWSNSEMSGMVSVVRAPAVPTTEVLTKTGSLSAGAAGRSGRASEQAGR